MSKKINNKKKILVRHMDCEHARLMRRGDNPVIAECTLTRERHVANTPTVCPNFFLCLDKEIGEMEAIHGIQ